MKEIKFRYTYRKEDSNTIISKTFTLDEIEVGCLNQWYRSLKGSWLNVGRDEYTGRKDKDGKEIYESDITNEGIVEFCDCLNWDGGGSLHPGFYFKEGYKYGERGDLDYHTGFDDIKIIGNLIKPRTAGG